jgi:ribosomal-protein-alanine N-acetyltransferase
VPAADERSGLWYAHAPKPLAGMLPPLSTQLLTERLRLRPPRAADVTHVRRLLRENTEHLRPWSPSAATGHDPLSLVELTRAIVFQRREWSRDRMYAFLVLPRSDDAPLGRVTLSDIARGAQLSASLGYWVDARSQGLGYATEAAEAALRFAFETLGLHRVQAAVMPENDPSRRVLEKLGFREEGFARGYLRIAGTWRDHRIFAITREEHVAR